MSTRKVSYFYAPELSSFSYGSSHCMQPIRVGITESLVRGYGLDEKLELCEPVRIGLEEFVEFHAMDYVCFLRDVTPDNATERKNKKLLRKYGLSTSKFSDCPVVDGIFDYCRLYAGATIGAARKLMDGSSDISINYSGGLHHGRADSASGFCYVNDVVLGIKELLDVFARVAYIDLDAHHGNAVQDAYYSMNRVLTISLHRWECDFFPLGGSIRETGVQDGRFHAVNVPLSRGIRDQEYLRIFDAVLEMTMTHFRPNVFVVQSGADSLAGDLYGCFNLSIKAHAECIKRIRATELPILVLGGGGYHVSNTGKCWAYETAVLLGEEEKIDLNPSIPESSLKEFPGMWEDPETLHAVVPPVEDRNSKPYLDLVLHTVVENLRTLRFAPDYQLFEPTTSAEYRTHTHFPAILMDTLDEDIERRRKRVIGQHFLPDGCNGPT